VLNAVNAAVSSPLRPEDVTASWAGLRPLLATTDARGPAPSSRTADLSRRHKVERSASGLITVTGGKLTTYRKMAADTVDAVQRELGSTGVASRTKRLRLRGSEPVNALQARQLADKLGLDAHVLDHLQRRYGGETMAVLGLSIDRPELRARLVDSAATRSRSTTDFSSASPARAPSSTLLPSRSPSPGETGGPSHSDGRSLVPCPPGPG
jgi:glycerol-3-phosphate dehydrogenase